MGEITPNYCEPWSVMALGRRPYTVAVTSSTPRPLTTICMGTDTGGGPFWPALWPGDQDKFARRIVACVNACAGVPMEALEADCLGKLYAAAQRLLAGVNVVMTRDGVAATVLIDDLRAAVEMARPADQQREVAP